ncbi:MAG TPA: hypothetical protein VH163_04900 [Gemmatimonadales bacterium]|nr:hypothetical protein [Gemmatimonadales bacterium]
MRTSSLVALLGIGLAGFSAPYRSAHLPPSVFRITVNASTPGSVVALRFVHGPDSLTGTTRRFSAPATLEISGDSLVLLAEDNQGHGDVTLNVERLHADLRGSGTGGRVHLRISAAGVRVWTSSWWTRI